MKYKTIHPLEKKIVYLYCIVMCPFVMIIGFLYGLIQLVNPFTVAMEVYRTFVKAYNEAITTKEL